MSATGVFETELMEKVTTIQKAVEGKLARSDKMEVSLKTDVAAGAVLPRNRLVTSKLEKLFLDFLFLSFFRETHWLACVPFLVDARDEARLPFRLSMLLEHWSGVELNFLRLCRQQNKMVFGMVAAEEKLAANRFSSLQSEMLVHKEDVEKSNLPKQVADFCKLMCTVWWRSRKSTYDLQQDGLDLYHDDSVLMPMYRILFNETFKNSQIECVEPVFSRSINFGGRFCVGRNSFELLENNVVKMIVLVFDQRSADHRLPQMVGACIGVAQSQMFLKKTWYTVRCLVIVDYKFEFYEIGMSDIYLQALGRGFLPEESVVVTSLTESEKSEGVYSFLRTNERTAILKLLLSGW